MSNQWTDVPSGADNPQWDFNQYPQCMGYFVSTEHNVGEYNSTIAKILNLTNGITYTVWCNKLLAGRFESIPTGIMVNVQYLGKKKGKNGDYHNYNIQKKACDENERALVEKWRMAQVNANAGFGHADAAPTNPSQPQPVQAQPAPNQLPQQQPAPAQPQPMPQQQPQPMPQQQPAPAQPQPMPQQQPQPMPQQQPAPAQPQPVQQPQPAPAQPQPMPQQQPAPAQPQPMPQQQPQPIQPGQDADMPF